jgi:hypothetical protein
MAKPRQKKSAKMRVAGYKAAFRKTSKGECYYKKGIRPLWSKYFLISKNGEVVVRGGFTDAKILAAIGGEATYNRVVFFRQKGARKTIEAQLVREANQADREGDFDPRNSKDGRRKIIRAINLRRGQPAFRKKILEAYNHQCALTKCDCVEALEAAHISPYRGGHTNHVQNGILLRSDIHTLFDIGLMGFAPNSHKVVLSSALRASRYGILKGRRLSAPSRNEYRPNEEALRQHLRRFGLGQ